MLPNEEDAVWSQEANPYPSTPSRKDPLAQRFPELVRAGGTVDPAEAIAALLDKVHELEGRIEELGSN